MWATRREYNPTLPRVKEKALGLADLLHDCSEPRPGMEERFYADVTSLVTVVGEAGSYSGERCKGEGVVFFQGNVVS